MCLPHLAYLVSYEYQWTVYKIWDEYHYSPLECVGVAGLVSRYEAYGICAPYMDLWNV